MKKALGLFFTTIIGLTVLVPVFIIPAQVRAQENFADEGIVHCGRKTDGANGITTRMCTFDDLIVLVGRIIRWVFGIVAIIAAVVVIYIGWIFLSAGGNGEALSKAKHAAKSWVTGFVLVLVAWLLVSLILRSLLSDEYLAAHPNAILLEKVDTSGSNKTLQEIVTGK